MGGMAPEVDPRQIFKSAYVDKTFKMTPIRLLSRVTFDQDERNINF